VDEEHTFGTRKLSGPKPPASSAAAHVGGAWKAPGTMAAHMCRSGWCRRFGSAQLPSTERMLLVHMCRSSSRQSGRLSAAGVLL